MKKIFRSFCFFLVALHFFSITAYSAEQIHFFHTDPVGTPLAITDANGDVVWRAEYKPFGEEQSVTASNHSNDRTFVGKEKDGETGFHYFDARYLDSHVGRFTSPDPVDAVEHIFSEVNYAFLTEPQRLNPYAYGLNNPYRYVDPDGLYTYSAKVDNTSGGEFVGGGIMKVTLTSECYEGKKYIGEFFLTLGGLTVGAPVGKTIFEIEVDDGYTWGGPKLERMEGFSLVLSATFALGPSASTGILLMGEGVIDLTDVSRLSGIDISSDFFIGYSKLKNRSIRIEECSNKSQ